MTTKCPRPWEKPLDVIQIQNMFKISTSLWVVFIRGQAFVEGHGMFLYIILYFGLNSQNAEYSCRPAKGVFSKGSCDYSYDENMIKTTLS